ncbi:MAG: right-handed parallel beta-helix repeat-containing protein [Paracoccaceae bacterium]|nr:right-handed parallel beta-helix repeat-containing protein [Paracoccaceae bacterium]
MIRAGIFDTFFSRTIRVFWMLVAAFALGIFPSEVDARTIYVDDDQTGRGNGSRAAPYATITEAANRVQRGDVVVVAPGVYTDRVQIKRGGSQDNPVTFRPMKRGTVIIDGSETRRDSDLVKIIANNVIFEGFEIRNARRSGISIWGSRNVTIRGNTISGSVRSAIWAGYSRPGKSKGILIEGNTVYGNVLENRSRSWSSGWARAIGVDLTEGAVVHKNRVYHNYGEGIGALSTENVKIYSNTVFDNFSVNIYLDNAPQTSVRGNNVYTKRKSSFYRNRKPAAGIVIANERTRFMKPSSNIRVTENRLTGVGDVFYGTWGANTGLKNSVIGPNRIR